MITKMEINDAKAKIDELISRANAGEEFLLAEQGKPVAKLIPVEQNPRLRVLGMYEGKVWMSEDFDAPLTDEELKDWGL